MRARAIAGVEAICKGQTAICRACLRPPGEETIRLMASNLVCQEFVASRELQADTQTQIKE